jgi:ABC-2 type transport system permease protein
MKPIIRWSLWERRWGALGWSVGIGAFIALNILVYSSISGQAQALNQALNNLPAGAKALFGGSGDFLSPIGYLNSKLYYLFLPLMFTMLALSLVRHMFSREEDSGTMELLLAWPVSRGKLLLAKLLSSLIILVGVGMVSLLVTIASAASIDYAVTWPRLFQATAMSLLIGMLFGAVAWALVSIGRAGKLTGTAAAGALALASYLFSSLQSFAVWLEWPAKLLPYHYYHPTAILEGTYNWWNAAGMGLATLVLLTIAYLAFRRRDLG